MTVQQRRCKTPRNLRLVCHQPHHSGLIINALIMSGHSLSELSSYRRSNQEDSEPSLSVSGPSLAPFISKLFEIITKAKEDDCIKWGARGDTIVVTDPVAFARNVLPRYFKHDNIRSFVRQLNIYGFQRCRNAGSGADGTGELEFYHESFVEGRQDLMLQITRGVPSQKPVTGQKRSLPAPQSASHSFATDAASLLREMNNVQENIVAAGQQLRSQIRSAQAKMTALSEELGIQLVYTLNENQTQPQQPPPLQPAQPQHLTSLGSMRTSSIGAKHTGTSKGELRAYRTTSASGSKDDHQTGSYHDNNTTNHAASTQLLHAQKPNSPADLCAPNTGAYYEAGKATSASAYTQPAQSSVTSGAWYSEHREAPPSLPREIAKADENTG